MEFVIPWPTPREAVGVEGSPDFQPAIEPLLEFTIRRVPEIEMTNSEIEARGTVRKEGGDLVSSDSIMSWLVWRSFHLAIRLAPFVKSCKALDGGEAPKAIESDMKAFISSMELHERVDLGAAYILAVEEDKSRPTEGPSSAPAS